MDHQQAEQQNVDVQRPTVLDELSESQLTELETQFDERDRKGFDWRAESFGWTADQAQAVWNYFTAGKRTVGPASNE